MLFGNLQAAPEKTMHIRGADQVLRLKIGILSFWEAPTHEQLKNAQL
jgi:hypothetical protein